MSGRKMIPPETIEEIKEKNDIVSTVEQYVHLTKKSSSNLFGLCPFHSEKTPSFSVSPGKQIFYCFGCHKGGDVVNFIMEIEKLDYYEALKYLAERAGVQLPEYDDAQYKEKAQKNKKIIEINTEAARFYYKNLIGDQGKAARDYLDKRKLSVSTLRKFGIGFAPGGWNGLLNHLLDKGYPYDSILESGLIKRKDAGKGYDIFRERIIFPIFDQMGRIVAFGGRVLDDSLPKYINSPETPVYTKGRHLYGFNIAKRSKADKLLVVEGYMDVLAIYQAGVDFVVGALGTALTQQQAMLIRNYSEKVVIAFDADQAGADATMRGLDILKEKGCDVSVLRVTGAKDPDEYIKTYGPERFHGLIDRSVPLMDYKLDIAYKKNHDGEKLDKIGYQDMACDILSLEENIVIRELYSAKVAANIGVSAANVLTEIQRRADKGQNKKQQPLFSAVKREDSGVAKDLRENTATREELYLLCLMAYSNEIYDSIKDDIVLTDFSPGLMRKIAAKAIEEASKGSLTNGLLFTLGADNIVNGRKLTDLFASGCMKAEELKNVDEAKEEAARYNLRLRISRLLAKKEEAADVLTDPDSGDEDKKNARKKILELTIDINRIKSNKR